MAEKTLGRPMDACDGDLWMPVTAERNEFRVDNIGADVVLDLGSDSGRISYLNGLEIDNKLRQTGASGSIYFLQDHLASTAAVSDSTGNVVERLQYEPFGSSSDSVFARYSFTGRERDTATGLIYYRARYYDPAIGRFISEDPIGFNGGINFYAYALNNPIYWTDPFGLDVLRCERPLKAPGAHDVPHTFLFSTQSNAGWGLSTASGWWVPSTILGQSVPGKLEPDNPFSSPGGPYKPGFSCSTVSKDKCVEKCVNENFKPPFPNYQLGVYQCDTWADDVVRRCKKACGDTQ